MNKQTLLGVIIIVIGAVILFSNVFDLEFSNEISNGEEASQMIDASNIKELTLRTSSVNVKLLPTDQDTIQMKLYDSNNKSYDVTSYVSQNLYDDELELSVKSPRKWYIPFQFKSYTYELTVPVQLIRELEAETKSGNIVSNKLDIENLTIQANSGNITVNDSTSESFIITATSGNIKLNDISSTSFSAEVSSGNITIEHLSSSAVSVRTTSGNAKVTSLVADDVEAESTSGNMTIKGEVTGINGSTSSGNLNLEINELIKESRLEATSGNINLKLRQEPSSLTVTHHKNSGSSSIGKSGFELISQDNRKLEGKFGSGDVTLHVKTTSGNFNLQ